MLPSLAVAEALVARGATVTFAGSPGRAEAQLVPDAGYELDTFEIAGFPRRPSVALAHSLLLAAKAPLACRAILSRRRPDVVLGGGGYVAGPMVLAAATMRTPAALMEADVHLGLANRLALPFAQRVFLATEIPGREGGKYRVTGRPVPASSRSVDRGEARRLFELPTDGAVLLVYGGSQGAHSLNELAVESFGADGPHVIHLAGERDFEALRGRVDRGGYRLLPYTHEFGAALAAADLALARAGGSIYELAAAGIPAVLVPVSVGNRRPPDEERAGLRARRRRGRCSRARARSRARPRAQPALGRRATGDDACGDAAARPSTCRGRDRRGGDPARASLKAGSCGSSASAAPA